MNIDVSSLLERLSLFNQEAAVYQRAYLHQYSALIECGRRCSDNLDSHNFKILSLAVYGWMPTILDSCDYSKQDDAILALKELLKEPDSIDENLYKRIHVCINNSYVGTSKVLHFLRPEIFPIWDSKVARYFGMEGQNKVNNIKEYCEYKGSVSKAINNADKEKMDRLIEVCKKFYPLYSNINLTAVRAVEQSIFMLAPSPLTKEKHKSNN